MEILIAKTAGFCFGVSRAVRLAEKAAETYDSCVTLGPIIHNKSVIEKLRSMGVNQIDDISQISPEDTVIVRSHGIGSEEYCELKKLGVGIVDATCPDVAAIHKTVKEESDAGRKIVIIGERDHPEVIAISQWCSDCIVFENSGEILEWAKNSGDVSNLELSIVSQTTGTRDNFEICVNLLKKLCTNSKKFDTICNATSKRQQEARELSQKCDAMIVIGGKTSANSKRLYDICRENCPKVFFIETADDLDMSLLKDVSILGITAGASTPAWIIKEVNQKMSDEMKNAENTAAAANEAEAATESFEEMLEKSIKTLHTGEKVTGIIAAITPTEVSVDLGTKQSGYIPLSELTDDPTAKPEDIVKVGDEIETYVMRVNDVEGTTMLSKKRLDSAKVWDQIDDAKDDKTVLEGIVTEENKGGIVVSVKGVRVFVPASQTGLGKDVPMSTLLKQKVRLRITEVNQSRRRVVGSIRAVQYEERHANAEKIWNEIEEGKRYKGVVKSLTSYGAFVDIGGIDGMVHVSELSWSRIHQPSDVLSVGDEIEVYVISFDKEKKKISLGYKDKAENPWLKFTGKYQVGSVAEVKIVKLMPFGAFAEVVPGVDGLIHISQIADRRIGKPEDVLQVGQVVNAKIIDIDNDKQKISLSIRALLAPDAEKKEEKPDAQASDDAPVVVYDTDAPKSDDESDSSPDEAE